MRDKLGIIYTPVPVVDFINHSVADILQKEFGTTIASPNVHILDPFTGTGTFLTRLMQSGLIPADKLSEKFKNDIHAHEILPLTYYIASINLEATYYDLVSNQEYEPNPVMIWTDTFADHDAKTLFSTSLAENNARLAKTEELDIRVIVGNPPYSVGQERQADNNENDNAATPVTHPVLKNLILAGNGESKQGIRLRRGTQADIDNAKVCGKGQPLVVESALTNAALKYGTTKLTNMTVTAAMKTDGDYTNDDFTAVTSNKVDATLSYTSFDAIKAACDWMKGNWIK